jgi:hypothetical protein
MKELKFIIALLVIETGVVAQSECSPDCLSCSINICMQCSLGFSPYAANCIKCPENCELCAFQGGVKCNSCFPGYLSNGEKCVEKGLYLWSINFGGFSISSVFDFVFILLPPFVAICSAYKLLSSDSESNISEKHYSDQVYTYNTVITHQHHHRTGNFDYLTTSYQRVTVGGSVRDYNKLFSGLNIGAVFGYLTFVFILGLSGALNAGGCLFWLSIGFALAEIVLEILNVKLLQKNKDETYDGVKFVTNFIYIISIVLIGISVPWPFMLNYSCPIIYLIIDCCFTRR